MKILWSEPSHLASISITWLSLASLTTGWSQILTRQQRRGANLSHLREFLYLLKSSPSPVKRRRTRSTGTFSIIIHQTRAKPTSETVQPTCKQCAWDTEQIKRALARLSQLCEISLERVVENSFNSLVEWCQQINFFWTSQHRAIEDYDIFLFQTPQQH